jgi:DNA-binding NarL/FixJ family response regulator
LRSPLLPRTPTRTACPTTRSESEGLTPKLKRVAELCIDGLTVDQIAEKLNYSLHTVRKYVSTVHQVLFARDRYQTFKKLTARY